MTLAEAIAEMRDTRIAASVVIVPWRKAAEEAQARIAELQERDAQWVATAILLSDVAADCEDACNDVLPGVCSWQKCAHGSRAACLRAWAGAPEPLTETDTPKEATDEHTDDGGRS